MLNIIKSNYHISNYYYKTKKLNLFIIEFNNNNISV